jgi:hypothetical protein
MALSTAATSCQIRGLLQPLNEDVTRYVNCLPEILIIGEDRVRNSRNLMLPPGMSTAAAAHATAMRRPTTRDLRGNTNPLDVKSGGGGGEGATERAQTRERRPRVDLATNMSWLLAAG